MHMVMKVKYCIGEASTSTATHRRERGRGRGRGRGKGGGRARTATSLIPWLATTHPGLDIVCNKVII